MDYLEIFDSVEYERNEISPLRVNSRQYERNEINEKRVNGISLAELEAEAREDWRSMKDDPDMLSAFASALATRRMRERGEVPAHYTATTTCAGCGVVPIFPGVPESVLGCPWCLNRVQGKTVPRPPEKMKKTERHVVGHSAAGVQVVVEDGDEGVLII